MRDKFLLNWSPGAHRLTVGGGRGVGISGEAESPHEEGCPFVPCERHLLLEDLSPVTAPAPSCLGLGGRRL